MQKHHVILPTPSLYLDSYELWLGINFCVLKL